MTASSIINKASNLAKKAGGTFVFGGSASGKTHTAIDSIPEDSNVLWVAMTNLKGLGTGKSEDWDVAQPSEWVDFYRHVLTPIVNGETDYDTVVIDGLHVLSHLCLHYVASARTKDTINPQISQNDWGAMGRLVGSCLIQLRATVDNFIVTAEVLPTDEGEDKIAMNRDLFNRTVGQFANKWYTYSVPVKDDKKQLTGEIDYRVEKNSAFAIRLRPSSS